MPTGRIVRDPPADQFVRVLTFDEARSLVSMDTEAPINIRLLFNRTATTRTIPYLLWIRGITESRSNKRK